MGCAFPEYGVILLGHCALWQEFCKGNWKGHNCELLSLVRSRGRTTSSKSPAGVSFITALKCALNSVCMDYLVCGLSVHNSKLLMTNDQGGK